MPEISIAKSLNNIYRTTSIDKQPFETFKQQLATLYQQISTVDTEEKLKGDLMDFLKLTFYGQSYKVSPNGSIDCAIHLGDSIESEVGVIFEVKMPSNTSEMITKENLNRKALQELLLYYLRERVEKKNIQLKQLVVTNIHEFFVFDAQEFERVFYSNKTLLKRFAEFSDKTLASAKTEFFYKEIAAEAIESAKGTLTYTWFDIRSYKPFLANGEDKRLTELYKVFSPEHLLKKRFYTDSNTLNTKFYSELLYIIGLEEVDENGGGGKRVITRARAAGRNPASILENAITILDSEDWIDNLRERDTYGDGREEQIFNVALALSIGWINRILFLKLLEAQLVKYHKGDASYAFLNPRLIPDYDELNKLFFQVLAKRPSERGGSVAGTFGKIPYLNSSLFEISELERKTIRISSLDNSPMPLCSGTVLKDGQKPLYKELPTLRYLLEFLDAYNFASDSAEDIRETTKTLINASVLGLIFEKINGHRDGSVFTPGAITMYMSREAVRAATVRKFNEAMGWNCPGYEALKDKDIDDLKKANKIMDSMRICDPAVGSGHFLVSALNEIIRTKYDLGILLDCNGKRIKKQDYDIRIENDELNIYDSEGVPFVYLPGNAECQRIQEALFKEKRQIIENCLFGVDINQNAVNICRLRLWIELLKNAYYTRESNYTEVETLPNIDINIKAGNSLIHRFDLRQDISEILRSAGITIGQYKDAVDRYKNAGSKAQKREMEDMIEAIKSTLQLHISRNDPKMLRKVRLEKELNELQSPRLFELSKKERQQIEQQAKQVRAKLDKVNDEISQAGDNKFFVGAFEWRIEFPEILDDEGGFEGFDCIIGNPPYIQLQKMGMAADALQKTGYETFERTGDIYCLFYEMGMELLKPNGILSFITSNKWMRAGYGKPLRALLSSRYNPVALIDFAGFKVFDSATVDVDILNIEKRLPAGHTVACSIQKGEFDIEKMSDYVRQQSVECRFDSSDSWVILSPIEQSIKQKIESAGTPLKDWDIQINYGIKTGYNDAFIISTEKREEILANCRTEDERSRTAELIRPILRGRDIKRYGYNWANLWLIATFPSRHYDIEMYPAVKAHLLSFGKERLEQTGKKYIINGKEVKARKKTSNKWFETQDSINYLEDFCKPKIVWGEISDRSKFAYDFNGKYVPEATSFLMVGDKLPYLLCVLNSPLAEYFFSKIGTTTGVGTVRWKKYTIQELLIPYPSNDIIVAICGYVESYINGSISFNELAQKANLEVYRIVGLTSEEIKYVEHFYSPSL